PQGLTRRAAADPLDLSAVESSRPRLCIDRCVCRRTRFEDLLPLAREHGWDREELSRATGCGLQCGPCRPSLRRMFTAATTLCADRCVCRRPRFEDLLPLAREHGWDLEELSRVTGCGLQCGLCRPYLRRMLIDGTTVFDTVLLDEEETT